VISGAAAEIAAGLVRRKEGGRALPAVIRTQGVLLEGRAGMGRDWLVGPAELGVHGAEERGGRLEQRNSGAGRKEKLTRWGRSVRGERASASALAGGVRHAGRATRTAAHSGPGRGTGWRAGPGECGVRGNARQAGARVCGGSGPSGLSRLGLTGLRGLLGFVLGLGWVSFSITSSISFPIQTNSIKSI